MIENIENLAVGIIGGGVRCKALLEAVFAEKDKEKRPRILGVADNNPEAAGIQYAQSLGITTTTDYRDLFWIEGLEVLLELTTDDGLKQNIQAQKPPGVLVMDHYEAQSLLDALRIKAKKIEMMEKIEECGGDVNRTADLFETFYRFVLEINQSANAYGKQTRQHLISSRQSLSQIINGSSIPTFVIDQDHRVTHWNRACERLTGFSARQMVGTDQQWKPFRKEKRPVLADLIVNEVSHDELWRLYGTHWEKSTLIEGGYEVEEFFSHIGEDGSWLFFTAAPIRSPEGDLIGAIETLWDRTQRRKIEAAYKNETRKLVRTVEELKASEQTMVQIINGSTIPTFVIDRDHRVTHWNRALEQLTGYSAESIIGSTRSWEPFYERERPSMADVILDQVEETQIRQLYGTKWRKSAFIEGGYEADAFFPQLGRSGKWCWFTAAPITTPEGQVVGAIETIWDKTEAVNAEREREQHTRELATYCSIYATLSGSLSLKGRVQGAIEEVAGIFMLAGICIFIRKPDKRFHLAYSHGFSDELCFQNRIADAGGVIEQVARESRMRVVEDLADCRDEALRPLQSEGIRSLVYIPLFDREHRTFGVIRAASQKVNEFDGNELRSLELIANRIGVAIENALLEQDIQQRAAFQAKLIGSSNDGIVATDEKLNIVIFNPPAESIFGRAAEDVIQKKTIQEIYPPQIADVFSKAVAPNAPDQWSLPWQESWIPSVQGEEIPVRISGTILRQKHRKMGTVAFFQDLREIKRLERELIDAERLAAVGQTVAGMAHCVKNILHGLKGGSYMVNVGIEKGNQEKLQSGWKMVQRNIGRTSDLVQDLLSYSKERKPEMEACRPNDIVQEVMELMEAVAAEDGVTLDAHLSPDIGEVILDQRSLHRSLLNLLSNAIDACRDDPATDKRHCVRVATAVDPDNFIRLDVADNGCGMDDSVKNKLFTSFFSTKGAKGTGLGLLVTGKLIEEHNGTVTVDSSLGRGTTFHIRLPLAKDCP